MFSRMPNRFLIINNRQLRGNGKWLYVLLCSICEQICGIIRIAFSDIRMNEEQEK